VTFVTRSSVDSQTAMRRQLSEADAARMGDLFEYKIKERVTIRKGQSALVPILTGDIRAEKVSIWNASEDSRRAMRALWITNTTGLTLDGGSFSVVDGQSFAGEGLMDPLKPGERRLLSFALDLGLTVDAGDQEDTEKVTSVRVERGVMRQTVQERRKVTYTMRNKDAERKVVIVEHPAEDGWTLAGLTADETTADWHRFRVEVAPGESKTLVVEEEHPYCEDLQVSALTDDQLTLLVRARALDSALEAWLKDVQARKSALAGLNAQGQRHKAEIEQIAADQKRVRENMLALKGSIEERLLIRRYVQQLDEQETRLRTLNDELRAILAETEKAQADLNRIIEGAGSM
jgi:hypothetical protein